MEGIILYAIKWDLCFTTPLTYLHQYFKSNHGYQGAQDCTYFLAQYFIEQSLVSYKMIGFGQNIIAASSLYLANKFRRKEVCWTESLVTITGYKESDLRQCAKGICLALKELNSNEKLKAVKKKYSSARFLGVSMLPELGTE